MRASFTSRLQMDKMTQQRIENNLREQLGAFLRSLEQQWPGVREVLEIIKQKKWPAVICGGTIRSQILKGNSLPKDLDIIIDFAEKGEIEKAFRRFPQKKTKLGGISLKVKHWDIDMWPLEETWAIKNTNFQFKPTFQDYTRTTFLNIDAIAVDLWVKPGKKRRVYSNHFFDGLINRTIEINLMENPDPLGCIVKSIVLSKRYHFKIGPRLARYIVSHMEENDLNDVRRIYKEKYFGKEIGEHDFEICLDRIKRMLSESSYEAITVFDSDTHRQLEFKF